jgi:glucose-6-phosphate isomerase
MYFDFARSSGLSYWQSLLYSIGGSELWETAGETGPPSFNDHVASGIGGSFLGESLFRMASLLL